MSELYTSLTQLKMAMNGGTLPPMTPLTERAAKLLDPAFTIGMGALMEDAEKGLRCPVRGCGMWLHPLTVHLNTRHRNIGGAAAIKRLLSIPITAKLMSNAERETHRRNALARNQAQHGFKRGHRPLSTARRNTRAVFATVGSRNLRDQCEAQLKHKFIDLYNAIGRVPSRKEFAAKHGAAILGRIVQVYGTYNNGVTHFGCEPNRRGASRVSKKTGRPVDSVGLLAGLQAWYNIHGDLPSMNVWNRPEKAPLIHHYKTYLREFKTDSWPEAMRRAAAMLDIYGGKYGLPESARPKEKSA